MASPCDYFGNCSPPCNNDPYCTHLPQPPPWPLLPPIQPIYDSSDNNSSKYNNQQIETVTATLITTILIFIVFAIVCGILHNGEHHDEPLQPTPSTLAQSTITTIQTTNVENNSDDNDHDTAHHVCQISTAGLDDHIIKSIASSVYNGTSGHGSMECCSVCLGEFYDGEEVKLLHSCCHMFHALCIDTWLKSHVNCPLCRKTVIDSSDHPEPKQADSVITIDSVSEFGSSASRSVDNDNDLMPGRTSGSFNGLFSLELSDSTNIFLPSKASGQER